jgi:hypothetical protein
MRHIVGFLAGGLVLFVLARGFFGSFWRKPPDRQDSTATDWSSYGVGDPVDRGPSDHGGPP